MRDMSGPAWRDMSGPAWMSVPTWSGVDYMDRQQPLERHGPTWRDISGPTWRDMSGPAWRDMSGPAWRDMSGPHGETCLALNGEI